MAQARIARRCAHRQPRRPTFRQMFESTRCAAGSAAYNRAVLASQIRHLACGACNFTAARRMGDVKINAALRACELAPEMVRIGIDSSFQIGLPCIHWSGRPSMHLPAAAWPLLEGLNVRSRFRMGA